MSVALPVYNETSWNMEQNQKLSLLAIFDLTIQFFQNCAPPKTVEEAYGIIADAAKRIAAKRPADVMTLAVTLIATVARQFRPGLEWPYVPVINECARQPRKDSLGRSIVESLTHIRVPSGSGVNADRENILRLGYALDCGRDKNLSRHMDRTLFWVVCDTFCNASNLNAPDFWRIDIDLDKKLAAIGEETQAKVWGAAYFLWLTLGDTDRKRVKALHDLAKRLCVPATDAFDIERINNFLNEARERREKEAKDSV